MPSLVGSEMCIRDRKATGEDKPGALADLASVFAKLNINISNVYTKDLDERFTEFIFEGNVCITKEVKKLMAKILSIKFITSCIRVVNDAKSENEKTNY